MFFQIEIPASNRGYPQKSLKHLIGKKIDLSSGVNVFYGPNGSGKTTLLRLLDQYSGNFYFDSERPNHGPKLLNILRLNRSHGSDYSFPDSFFDNQCGHANIQWSGRPVVSTYGLKSFMKPISVDTLDDLAKLRRMAQSSTGQMSGCQLMTFCEEIKEVNEKKDYWPVCDVTRVNYLWSAAQTKWKQYIQEHRKDCPESPAGMTVLMDEPEIGLDIVSQANFYEEIRMMSQQAKIQVIVTSHSAFSLHEEFNVVSTFTSKRYVEKCRKALKDLTNGFELR